MICMKIIIYTGRVTKSLISFAIRSHENWRPLCARSRFHKTKSALTSRINHESRQIFIFRDVRLARGVLREKLQRHALQLNVSASRMVVCHISLSDNLCLNAGFDPGYPGFQFRRRISSFATRPGNAPLAVNYSSHVWDSLSFSISSIQSVPSPLSARNVLSKCPEPNERLFVFLFWSFLHWKQDYVSWWWHDYLIVK